MATRSVETLSVGELKASLKALSISDSDCLYKTDLQSKLRKAVEENIGTTSSTADASAKESKFLDSLISGTYVSAKQSGSGSSSSSEVDLSQPPTRFPLTCHFNGKTVHYEDEPMLVGNTANPTHLATLVHGLGDSAGGWRSAAKMLAKALPHVLFMLPTAPRQPVTINGGAAMNAWFDIVELGAGLTPEQLLNRKTDTNGVLTSARYVALMAGHIAHKHKIPTNKIIFGGFSQGAAVSIAAALTAPFVPRAVMPLSGFFPASKEVLAASTAAGQLGRLVEAKVPFHFFHGDADQVLPVALARMSVEGLKAAGIPSGNLDLKVYKGMGHSTSNDEMREIFAFLSHVTSTV